MKVTWQADDIVPGRIVGNPERLERWLIGYFVGGELGPSDRRYTLISLADGMVMEGKTAVDLAADLNSAGEMPIEFFSDPSHVKRGQKGGKARADSLSPQRRSEIASAAAKMRWNNSNQI